MICTKAFTVEVEANCTGLASDAAWVGPTYSPAPLGGYVVTSTFLGYNGEYEISAPTPVAGAQGVTWRVDWTGVAGATLQSTATAVGTIDRTGLVALLVRVNILMRNAGFYTDTILCGAGVVTAISLTAVASQATASAAEFVQFEFIGPRSGAEVTGEVTVQCV